MSTRVTPNALFMAATRLSSSKRASLWAMERLPTWRKPVDCSVSLSSSSMRRMEYSHRRAWLSLARMVPTSPAACQLVPQANCLRSSNTTSLQPSFPR